MRVRGTRGSRSWSPSPILVPADPPGLFVSCSARRTSASRPRRHDRAPGVRPDDRRGSASATTAPLLIATKLDPPAHPSARYTKKYDKATSLQKQLEKEQKRLARAAGDQLEASRRSSSRKSRRSKRQQARAPAASSRTASATVDARAAGRRAPAAGGAPAGGGRPGSRREARPIVGAPRVHPGPRTHRRATDRSTTTDPDRLRRLRARLARLQGQGGTHARPAGTAGSPGARCCWPKPSALAAQAETLQTQADALQAQADALKARETTTRGPGRRAAAPGGRAPGPGQVSRSISSRRRRRSARPKRCSSNSPRCSPRPAATRVGRTHGSCQLQDALRRDATTSPGVSPPQVNDAGDAAVLNTIRATAPVGSGDGGPGARRSARPRSRRPTEGSGVTAYRRGQHREQRGPRRADRRRGSPLVVATVIAPQPSCCCSWPSARSFVPVQAAVTNLLVGGRRVGRPHGDVPVGMGALG